MPAPCRPTPSYSTHRGPLTLPPADKTAATLCASCKAHTPFNMRPLTTCRRACNGVRCRAGQAMRGGSHRQVIHPVQAERTDNHCARARARRQCRARRRCACALAAKRAHRRAITQSMA
jgi:hypothetical protein